MIRVQYKTPQSSEPSAHQNRQHEHFRWLQAKIVHEINKVLNIFHLRRSAGFQESGSRKGGSSGDILRQEKIVILALLFLFLSLKPRKKLEHSQHKESEAPSQNFLERKRFSQYLRGYFKWTFFRKIHNKIFFVLNHSHLSRFR